LWAAGAFTQRMEVANQNAHKACLPLSHKFGPLLTEKASAAIAHIVVNSAH